MPGLRVVVASCVIHRGRETFSTTVEVTVGEDTSHFELNRMLRSHAAAQMTFYNGADPSEVIVLNQEDITYQTQ